jgi:hypothetical protein
MPRATWTKESAQKELDVLIGQIDALAPLRRRSASHVEWLVRTVSFLSDVFGQSSGFYHTFAGLSWQREGTFLVHAFTANVEVENQHQQAYREQLEMARGLLAAAKLEVKRKGLEGVYEGKSTAPETSAIVKVLALTEHKLRKIVRQEPANERQLQDVVENLFIAADLAFAREVDRIEYSSKSYVPDFTMQKLDLAVEIKLCNTAKREKEIIAEINDDILAYKQTFGNLLFIVYDLGQIRDVEKFKTQFEQQDQVIVQVVKH